jgi:TPR repeat protein
MNIIGLALALLVVSSGAGFQAFGQTTQFEKKQFEMVKAQAERGDAQAQMALGSLYATGTGTGQDSAKATKWHRKAAEQGLVQAQVRVAYEYMNGIGVKADPIEGARWVRRAADQGSTEAQFELGRCYAEALGVGENQIEAAKSYRKAADQNFAPAQFALGTCYFEGNGVTKDIPEGIAWTRKAAEQGYPPAENSLGMCYAKGKGVAQDYLEAYKWFNLAASQGGEINAEAKINLSMAERAMTPEQIAQGQKLAREFKPHAAATPSNTRVATNENGSSDNSKTGIVSVKADNETSEVFLDGAFIGNAPAKLKLDPGMHVIEVRQPGFKTYHKELKVTAGSELSLRAMLERQ